MTGPACRATGCASGGGRETCCGCAGHTRRLRGGWHNGRGLKSLHNGAQRARGTCRSAAGARACDCGSRVGQSAAPCREQHAASQARRVAEQLTTAIAAAATPAATLAVLLWPLAPVQRKLHLDLRWRKQSGLVRASGVF